MLSLNFLSALILGKKRTLHFLVTNDEVFSKGD